MTSLPNKLTDDLDIRVRALGCPYPNSDPRSTVWLEGYVHNILREAGLPNKQPAANQ